MFCDAHGVEPEHGRLDADTIIWAAGAVANSVKQLSQRGLGRGEPDS
jgi:hypothetical protein